MALANILRGLPLNALGEYTGTTRTLLNPFAWLFGALNLAMLATHGALYLAMRAEDELAARAARWAQTAWLIYLPLTLAAIVAALRLPHLLRNFAAYPGLWVLPALAVLAVLFAGIWNSWNARTAAFFASTAAIALLLSSAAVALFPLLVPALGHPAFSLTAANASSTPLTLLVMSIVALIGLPLVAIYTIWVYAVFWGKISPAGHY